MPTVTPTTNYLDYAGLQKYDELIKQYIGDQADTTSLHTVKEDADARKIYFYKEAEADITDTTTPAYTIDYSDIDTAIGDVSTLTTTTTDLTGAVNELDAEIGDMSIITVETAEGVKATTVVAAANKLQSEVDDINTAIGEAPDADEGIAGSGMKKDIADLQEAVENAEAAGKVTMEEISTGLDTGVLKKYDFYQGVTAEDTAEQKAAKKIGSINLAKDLVVTAGEVVVIDDENPVEGQANGTYLKLTIANQDAPVYINVADLANDFTVEEDATSVQLTIGDDREISAVLVDDAVTTAKIADSNVTADKLADSVLEQFPGIIPLEGENSIAKLFETASDPTP